MFTDENNIINYGDRGDLQDSVKEPEHETHSQTSLADWFFGKSGINFEEYRCIIYIDGSENILLNI
jgi:hypothetical protein